MSVISYEEVTSVHHWTDSLFTFTTTRNPSFRFQNGQPGHYVVEKAFVEK